MNMSSESWSFIDSHTSRDELCSALSDILDTCWSFWLDGAGIVLEDVDSRHGWNTRVNDFGMFCSAVIDDHDRIFILQYSLNKITTTYRNTPP